ncbi:MAG: phosphatase [Candidatus Binatia bacterium]|nr:MAG: phosphatase [Candidatus Binatia bacterium]
MPTEAKNPETHLADAAALFDIDGVLVDSAEAHRRAWERLGEEIGRPFGEELFRRTFGQRNDSILAAWLGPGLPPDEAERLSARKEELYRELVRRGAIRVYPGVPELLRALPEQGFALAVASSGPRPNVELVLEILGVQGLVGAAVSAEDVTRGKPDPEPFLRAAERLGLAPERCIVVEDSVHGIEAARRAGMRSVAVLTSTDEHRLRAAGADLVVPEAGALSASLLRELLAKGGRN